ncbi:MAG: ATP-binding protein [Verrucomicrobiota bacterium]
MPDSSATPPNNPTPKVEDLGHTLTENLLRNSKDAIFFKDLDSRFVKISNYLATRLGIEDPQELIGKTDFDIFDHAHAKDARDDELEIIATGESKEGKLEREILNDGQTRWVLTSKMALRSDAGEIIGTFGISRDITAQKEAEFALEESNTKLIEASRRAGMAEIAINVLHNIGNVLNSVNISTASSLQMAESLKPPQLSKVAVLLESNAENCRFLSEDERGKKVPPYLRKLGEQMTQTQEQIVEELRALSRHVEHIKGILKTQQNYVKTTEFLEQFRLEEIVTDAIQINRDALIRHRIKVSTDLKENPILNTDKHRLLQILINLIRNAKSACDAGSPDEKSVQISSRLCGLNKIDIIVEDNGIGIQTEHLEAIFQHGFTTRDDGNGFGLHSCAILATELGGEIIVNSDGHKRGANFTIRIPVNIDPQKPVQI